MDGETKLRIDSLKSLFNLNKQEKEIKRRGIEILGDLISSVTGVPSAQDHRAVLESMRLLRLDASEIKSLLKTNANANQALLKSLSLHESRITQNDKSIIWLTGQIIAQQSYADSLLELLNFKARNDLNLARADQIISDAENILQEGRMDRVSEKAIDAASLGDIIESIILKHRILRPVFEGADCNQYFKLSTAHSWAEEDSNTIYSLLQIPMADMSDRNEVVILSPSNICLLYTSPSPRD